MPEVTIHYKKPETLKILKSLSKYLDFTFDKNKEQAVASVDGILIRGDKSLSVLELKEVFTGTNINAKGLRKEAWKRNG